MLTYRAIFGFTNFWSMAMPIVLIILNKGQISWLIIRLAKINCGTLIRWKTKQPLEMMPWKNIQWCRNMFLLDLEKYHETYSWIFSIWLFSLYTKIYIAKLYGVSLRIQPDVAFTVFVFIFLVCPEFSERKIDIYFIFWKIYFFKVRKNNVLKWLESHFFQILLNWLRVLIYSHTVSPLKQGIQC